VGTEIEDLAKGGVDTTQGAPTQEGRRAVQRRRLRTGGVGFRAAGHIGGVLELAKLERKQPQSR
jgi:hypothetical protein